VPHSRGPTRTPLDARSLAVTRHLLVHGPASRGALGRELSLSDASMSRIARSLMRDGIIAEQLDAVASVGRPRQILSAVPSARHVVGVKLTAETAYGVACNMLGDIEGTAELPLPEPVDGVVPVAETVRVVARLVLQLSRRLPSLDGVGVSIGGVVADRTLVREGTFLGWHDVDLGGLLHAATGVHVVLTNDVTALAREQLWFGAGRTHTTFGVMTVGAGLGFAVVREGSVLEQLIDNGHLLAHSPVDASGPRCAMGHHGCVSAYLNGPDFERRLPRRKGSPRTFGEAVRDPRLASSRVVEEAARALGHVVATFAGALQTDRIVLAGEDVEPLFASPVVAATIAERLRPGPEETQRCELDVSTAPLTFTDWARGAAVTSVQRVLGAG
jgi:predicted NBD/HSP70 family sugar kinase